VESLADGIVCAWFCASAPNSVVEFDPAHRRPESVAINLPSADAIRGGVCRQSSNDGHAHGYARADKCGVEGVTEHACIIPHAADTSTDLCDCEDPSTVGQLGRTGDDLVFNPKCIRNEASTARDLPPFGSTEAS